MATVTLSPARLFQVRIDGVASDYFSNEGCAQLYASTFNRMNHVHRQVAVVVELDPDNLRPVGEHPASKPRFRILIARDGRILRRCKEKKGLSLKKAVGVAEVMNRCLAKRNAMAIVAPMLQRVEGGAA